MFAALPLHHVHQECCFAPHFMQAHCVSHGAVPLPCSQQRLFSFSWRRPWFNSKHSSQVTGIEYAQTTVQWHTDASQGPEALTWCMPHMKYIKRQKDGVTGLQFKHFAAERKYTGWRKTRIIFLEKIHAELPAQLEREVDVIAKHPGQGQLCKPFSCLNCKKFIKMTGSHLLLSNGLPTDIYTGWFQYIWDPYMNMLDGNSAQGN